MDYLITKKDLIEHGHNYMIEAKGKIPEIRAYLEDVCGFKKAYWDSYAYRFINNNYLVINDFEVRTTNLLYGNKTRTINIDHLVFPENVLDLGNYKPLNLKDNSC